MNTQPETDADLPFKARLPNAKYLTTLLRAIHFKEKANCSISELGLKFTVEDSQCVQAIAYLNATLFDEYRFSPTGNAAADPESENDTQPEWTFGIDLGVLQDCLNVFGTAAPIPLSGTGNSTHGSGGGGTGESRRTPVDFRCHGIGEDLALMLQNNDVVTMCKLTTFEAEPPMVFDFLANPFAHKVIMKSEWLYAAFHELDPTSDSITILISPLHPFFRLSTEGIHGSTELDYPKEGDVLESFICETEGAWSYRFSHIQNSLKALAISTKTSLRINERGFLSMQFMIPCNDKTVSFVEFLCSPLETGLQNEDEEEEVDLYS